MLFSAGVAALRYIGAVGNFLRMGGHMHSARMRRIMACCRVSDGAVAPFMFHAHLLFVGGRVNHGVGRKPAKAPIRKT